MTSGPDLSAPSQSITSFMIACCLVSAISCSAPYAAESRLGSPSGERVEAARLGPEDQRTIRRALATAAVGHESVAPPAAAAHGVRWSDLDLAVYYATAEVEMAVVRTERTSDRHRYVIETIDEKPAELIVRRRPPPEVYEVEASVGRFGDQSESARRLVEALRTHMKKLGRKRGFSGPVRE